MKYIVAMLLAASMAHAEEVRLTPSNTVVLRTQIDEFSVTDTQIQLAELVSKRGQKDYPIYLVLDSPGGSIFAGDSLIQFAKRIKNLHTVTIFAASMAAMTVEALPGERLIAENGILMFHRASGQFEGQFEDGEVESRLDLWKQIVRAMEQMVSKRLSMSLSSYKEKIANEWWMYGETAVKQKAADKVVDVVCTEELVKQTTVGAIDTIFGPIQAVYSACPLFRFPLAVKE